MLRLSSPTVTPDLFRGFFLSDAAGGVEGPGWPGVRL